MKTNRILLMMAALTLTACHQKRTAKLDSCCAKNNAAAKATMVMPAAGGSSVYQLTGSWTDQHDRHLTLSKLQGHPQIVAMIFTHCTSVCPRIVDEMKTIRDSLPASIKKEVGGVLVSFDPERDTPARLSMFAAQRGLDAQWELLEGSDGQVRELSMALDVRYQKLSGGNFSHSGDIYILDENGNIVQSLSGLGGSVHSADSVLTRLVRR